MKAVQNNQSNLLERMIYIIFFGALTLASLPQWMWTPAWQVIENTIQPATPDTDCAEQVSFSSERAIDEDVEIELVLKQMDLAGVFNELSTLNVQVIKARKAAELAKEKAKKCAKIAKDKCKVVCKTRQSS
jgi:hypothetical protein